MEKENNRARASEFLELYRQLEEILEDKYRNTKRQYNSVVFEYSKDPESEPIRERLDVCRELRNLLTHNPSLDGEPVAVPSEPVINSIKEIMEFVAKPPLALEYATKGDDIMKAEPHEKVLNLMDKMNKRGFSHVPVIKGGVFLGVFSMGSVFRLLLKNNGRGVTADTAVRDLEEYLQLRDQMRNYLFVPRNETYISARRKFERVEGKDRRISVIFITENGRPQERLLGMLTPWDVMKEI